MRGLFNNFTNFVTYLKNAALRKTPKWSRVKIIELIYLPIYQV